MIVLSHVCIKFSLLCVTDESRGRLDSGGETPPTPLFDEDMSMPLEDFPRTTYKGPGWEMQLRQPNKKKITGQRCDAVHANTSI